MSAHVCVGNESQLPCSKRAPRAPCASPAHLHLCTILCYCLLTVSHPQCPEDTTA